MIPYSDYYSSQAARLNPYVLRIINDVHKGSKYCDFKNITERLDALIPDGKTYLNGDIVDLSCCPSSQVSILRAYQRGLINRWGDFYIRGNHDLLPDHTWYKIHILPNGKKVLITHGHLIGNEKRVGKWVKYEQGTPGASKWKLKWVDFADDMDWIKGIVNKPKDDVIAAAFALARSLGCDYVIMGHFHPNKRIDIIEDRIHLIFLPKGFNEVDLGFGAV